MNLLVHPLVGFTRLSVMVELSMERITDVPTATTRFLLALAWLILSAVSS